MHDELSVQASCEVFRYHERFLFGGKPAVRSVGIRAQDHPIVFYAIEFERNFYSRRFVAVIVVVFVVFVLGGRRVGFYRRGLLFCALGFLCRSFALFYAFRFIGFFRGRRVARCGELLLQNLRLDLRVFRFEQVDLAFFVFDRAFELFDFFARGFVCAVGVAVFGITEFLLEFGNGALFGVEFVV